MKMASDIRIIERLKGEQAGVFSTADLRSALAEPHGSAFARRVDRLIEEKVIARFARGFYVAEGFDLSVLSQRIAPASCISFGTVLARELVIGTSPARRVVATKVGPARSYAALGFEIEHLSISSHLDFGWEVQGGVRSADKEKAVLDVLYFHLRGRRYSFDIYSDLGLAQIDMDRIERYLVHYRNPKFIAFVRNVLEIQ
jgi:hypothetical protein